MNTRPTPIHILVALPAEATPIVHHFGLEPEVEGPIRVYGSERVRLYVSDVGAVGCASTVGYAFAQGECRRDAIWINVGIAGHRSLDLGTPRLAHKIIDHDTKRCWYPPITFERPCPSATICTVKEPRTDYDDDLLYDMEASAFIASAQRFSTAELTHVVKVVSDNRERPARTFPSKGEVREYVSATLPVVDAIVDALLPTAATRAAHRSVPIGYEVLLGRHHFTTTRARQLRDLLRRWHLVNPHSEPCELLGHHGSSRELLDALRASLEVRP